MSEGYFTTDEFSEILKQGLPVFIGIYLFLNPFPHKTALASIIFYASLSLATLLVIYRRLDFSFRTPLSLPMAIFVLWVFSGLFFAHNRENSIHDLYAHLLRYIFIFLMLYNFFAGEKKFITLVWVVIISNTLFALGSMIFDYAILGHSVTEKLGYYVREMYKTETPSNLIGVSILFALLLAINQYFEETVKYLRIILAVCMGILFTAIVATQARSAIIAMVVSLSILLLGKHRAALAALLCLLVLSVSLMPVKNRLTLDYVKDDSRTGLWMLYLEIVKDNPLRGMGFGMQTFFDEDLLTRYNARVPEKYRNPQPIYQPHNMLADVAARTGFVGLLLWLFVLFSFVKTGWAVAVKGTYRFVRYWGLCLMAAFSAIFVQSMFENVLSGAPAVVLYTIMGMMMILWHRDRESQTA
jgi:O-antigen ligase